MAAKGKLRYLKQLVHPEHLRAVPLNRLWLQLLAVFFLFSVVGYLVDLVYLKGQMPYAVVQLRRRTDRIVGTRRRRRVAVLDRAVAVVRFLFCGVERVQSEQVSRQHCHQ